MRHLVIGCCLLAMSATASAADKWTYAASEHFEVFTTGGEGGARNALTYFERVHAFFTEFLKLQPRRSGAPTRLIIFSNDRQFAPYKPNEVAAAFYQPGPDRDYIVMKSLDEESYPIVVHEYAHLVIRHSGDVYPLWFNEGLAEFFSTLEAEGKKMGIGKPPLHHLRYLTDGVPLMPLDQLLSVGHNSPEYNTRSHAGTFYAQSWALTHMLMADRRYRPAIGNVMQLLQSGTSSAAALEKTYGKPLESISRDLYNYVRQSQYLYFLYDYKSQETGEKRPTRPVDAFEAGLVTTNLLANSLSKEAEARASFERLAQEKPDDLRLLEARAYFELRRSRSADALGFLARAVAAGSTNAKVYRDYAMLDAGKAEQLLATAVSLSPEDVELRLHYASVLMTRGKYAEVIPVLTGATVIPYESEFQLSQMLASAYVQTNQLEEARAAAARAAARAGSPDQQMIAARMMKSLDNVVASRAAAAARASARDTSASDDDVAEGTPLDALAIDAALFTPAPEVPGDNPLIVVSGRIRNMLSCDRTPVLEVATATGVLRLLIDNGLAITVHGTKDGTVDLQCGPQDVSLKVGYLPIVDPAHKTVGTIRMLDYRAP